MSLATPQPRSGTRCRPCGSGRSGRSTSGPCRFRRAAARGPAWSRGTSTPGPRPWPGSGTAPTRSGCAATPRRSTPPPARSSRSYSADEPLGVTHAGAATAAPRVPVLLPPVRRGHVPPDPRRGRRRQDRPGVGGRQPAGVRHPHRALVRAGPRPPRRTAAGATPRRDTGQRCPHGRPTACHGRPRRGRPGCSGSRCARTATTTPRRWCGSGGPRSCGAGSPSPCAAWSPSTSASPPARLAEVATVQYAKVAEYQLRGVVHFHALIRLDGPRTPDGFAPAPAAIDAPAPGRPGRGRPPPRCGSPSPASTTTTPPGSSRSARQLDARPSAPAAAPTTPTGLTPEQVAGYLAKYATKSAADTGASDNRPPTAGSDATARHLAARADRRRARTRDAPYELLGKWAHMLGFRGHFATKSRRYSITLGALRRARRRAQALIAEASRDRPPARPGRPRGRPPRRRRRRDHPRHRLTGPTPAPAGPTTANAPSPPPPPPAPASTPRSEPKRGRRRTEGSERRMNSRRTGGHSPAAVRTLPTFERLWTFHDVSAFLGVPVGTLYQWRHRK